MRDDEEDYSKKVPYGFEDLFPECFENEPAIENNLQNKARSQSVNPFLNINMSMRIAKGPTMCTQK